MAASTTARTQSVLPGRVGQPFPGHAPGLLQGAAFRLVANPVYEVAISSVDRLKTLGLEFAAWNRVGPCAAAACIMVGLFSGGAILLVANYNLALYASYWSGISR